MHVLSHHAVELSIVLGVLLAVAIVTLITIAVRVRGAHTTR